MEQLELFEAVGESPTARGEVGKPSYETEMTREQVESCCAYIWFPDWMSYDERMLSCRVAAEFRNTKVALSAEAECRVGLVGWCLDKKRVRAVYAPAPIIVQMAGCTGLTLREAAEFVDTNHFVGMANLGSDEIPPPVVLELLMDDLVDEAVKNNIADSDGDWEGQS